MCNTLFFICFKVNLLFVIEGKALACESRSFFCISGKHRNQYVVGKIVIPNMSSCDGAVYVSGDSMYPLLKSGDIIGFKEISDFQHLIYGEMYLVSFCLDGNDYLVVKYVNRSEVSGCIQLVSYNPHHQPMDLPIENIQAMAIVKFSIRKNMM